MSGRSGHARLLLQHHCSLQSSASEASVTGAAVRTVQDESPFFPILPRLSVSQSKRARKGRAAPHPAIRSSSNQRSSRMLDSAQPVLDACVEGGGSEEKY